MWVWPRSHSWTVWLARPAIGHQAGTPNHFDVLAGPCEELSALECACLRSLCQNVLARLVGALWCCQVFAWLLKPSWSHSWRVGAHSGTGGDALVVSHLSVFYPIYLAPRRSGGSPDPSILHLGGPIAKQDSCTPP